MTHLHKAVIVGESVCGGADEDEAFGASDETVFLRGYNTYCGYNPADASLCHDGAGEVIAAVNGVVEVTDRVVSIRGRAARYLPEVGDVVIGRIVEVSGNRWLVDVNATQLAVMPLSNVTEPGGILRRRNRGDELGMRQMFDQEDLIVAEVQRVSVDGVASLHTRALEKYGKLTSLGQLVTVTPALMKRAKRHFYSSAILGCQLVLGMNGCIWVAQVLPEQSREAPKDEALVAGGDARANGARVANGIKVLQKAKLPIHPASIEAVVVASLAAGLSAFDVTLAEHEQQLTAQVEGIVGSKRRRI